MWQPTRPPVGPRAGWAGQEGPGVRDPLAGWSPLLVRQAVSAAIGGDRAALLAHLLFADRHRGRDTAGLAGFTGTEHLTSTDRAALLANLAGGDHGISADTASWLLHYDLAFPDHGRGTDAAQVVAQLIGRGTATGIDRAALAVSIGGQASTGLGSGSGSILGMNRYSGSRTATTLPVATWTDLLTFTASGVGTATVTFTVAHSWGSHFLHWASEQRGIRILVGGTQVASQTQSYTTGSWSTTLTQSGATVPAGSSVQIQGMAQGSAYTNPRTVTISSAAMTVQGVA